MDAINTSIEILVTASTKPSRQALEALQLTQAALNLAHTAKLLAEAKAIGSQTK